MERMLLQQARVAVKRQSRLLLAVLMVACVALVGALAYWLARLAIRRPIPHETDCPNPYPEKS